MSYFNTPYSPQHPLLSHGACTCHLTEDQKIELARLLSTREAHGAGRRIRDMFPHKKLVKTIHLEYPVKCASRIWQEQYIMTGYDSGIYQVWATSTLKQIQITDPPDTRGYKEVVSIGWIKAFGRGTQVIARP